MSGHILVREARIEKQTIFIMESQQSIALPLWVKVKTFKVVEEKKRFRKSTVDFR